MCNYILSNVSGLKKKVLSHLPGQVDSPSGQVTFQASHVPTKSLKEQTKTCPGQAKF